MKINGREIGLFYSVGAHCELDDFIVQHPNISETHVRVQEAVILNHAYHLAHPEDKTAPLTTEEILSLPNAVLDNLVREVAQKELEDSGLTVETEETEDTGKNAESTAQ